MTDFASVGARGTANEYNFSNNFITFSPSATCDAGDILVAWVSSTSHYFFGPDGIQTPESFIIDSVGNIWQQLVNVYAWETYVAMFASQLRADITTSDTLTYKHFGGGAKAISLHQFSLTPGKRWGLAFDWVVANGTTSSDPPSITISGLKAEREYLIMHVLGVEGPDTDTYTWDSDYTQIAGTGTTGHGTGGGAPPSSDYHVRGGYRIVSGITSDTIDVTSDTADRQADQAVVALTPIELDPDFPGFPNTPILDNFNRADEDPMEVSSSGPSWLHPASGGHIQFGDKWLKVVSNQCAESSGTSGGGSQYLDGTIITEDGLGEFEIWFTCAVAIKNLATLGTGDGNAHTEGGTGVEYHESGPRAFNSPGSIPLGLICFGDSGLSGNVAARSCRVWGIRADGTKIGMQQFYTTGDQIAETHLWIDEGSGWEWVACALRSTASSSYVTTGGWAIAFSNSPTSRIDDFGGGPLDRFKPQIFRRLPKRLPV